MVNIFFHVEYKTKVLGKSLSLFNWLSYLIIYKFRLTTFLSHSDSAGSWRKLIVKFLYVVSGHSIYLNACQERYDLISQEILNRLRKKEMQMWHDMFFQVCHCCFVYSIFICSISRLDYVSILLIG